MLCRLALVLLSFTAAAHAADPVAPLQARQMAATQAATAQATARDRMRQSVVERFADITRAEDAIMAARKAGRPDGPGLNTAMDALAKSKTAYDNAVAQEQAAIIAALQADAAARASRQALADAVTEWRTQGEALEKATNRAVAGEFVPTARETTACMDQDCGPIPPRDHAALVIMGAVGPTFDPKEWPAERAAQITLFSTSLPAAAIIRAARNAALDARQAAERDAAEVSARRVPLTAALPSWNTATQDALDAHFRPAANNHSEEVLTMALENLAQSDATLRPLGERYRAASLAADKSLNARQKTEAVLQDMLLAFGDMGRAVRRAALLAGRNTVLSATGTTLCRGTVCEPTSGLEAAAFVVIGAAAPGADKTLSSVIEKTVDGRWVFKAPRAL